MSRPASPIRTTQGSKSVADREVDLRIGGPGGCMAELTRPMFPIDQGGVAVAGPAGQPLTNNRS